jgi:hypothetical protein
MARKTPPRGFVVYDGPSMLTGDRIVAIATLHSTNRKTGNMVQVWYLLADHDPITGNRTGADIAICGNCGSRGIARPEAQTGMASARACYVDLGRAPMGIWGAWMHGKYPTASGHAAIAAIGRGREVRLGAYGDPAVVPSYINESLVSEANGHTAYSHQIAWSGPTGFDAALMMVSADQLPDAERAWSIGARTFRVVGDQSELVKGREILCPASEEAGKRTQCQRCLLCGGASVAAKSIAIVVHGAGKKHHTAAAG